MNVYQKLQKCRVELQKMNLKKSGENKYSGFSYYELADFLPQVNELFDKHGLCGTVSFGDIAILTITNAEKIDESLVFTSPLAEVNLKGTQPIQNMGGQQTYIRRYLYTNALEIVEADTLDAVAGKLEDLNTNKIKEFDKITKQKPKEEVKTDVISMEQVKRLFAIGKPMEDTKKIVLKYGYTSSKDIKKADYDKIILEVEQL